MANPWLSIRGPTIYTYHQFNRITYVVYSNDFVKNSLQKILVFGELTNSHNSIMGTIVSCSTDYVQCLIFLLILMQWDVSSRVASKNAVNVCSSWWCFYRCEANKYNWWEILIIERSWFLLYLMTLKMPRLCQAEPCLSDHKRWWTWYTCKATRLV